MKRLHVHVSVKTRPASIRFYRTLFGAEPVEISNAKRIGERSHPLPHRP
jgi:catechol 2,3-dioxygenase-like lactoylglutathione lyase family enzyme